MSGCSCRAGSRGAALVLALVVSAVVLLSTLLLLGYVEGMVSDQSGRELKAQAELSQESAAERAAALMREGRLQPGDPIPDGSLAGMETSFQVVETGQAGSRVIHLDLPFSGLRRLLPVRGFLAGYSRGGRLVLDHLEPSGARTPGFPVDLGRDPGRWDLAGFHRGPWLAAVVQGGGSDCLVTLVSPDGSTTTMGAELLLWRRGGSLQAGFVGGEPALVATNGRNWGNLLLLESGNVYYVFSPPGTSPMLLPGGGLFGTASDEGVLNGAGAGVVDGFATDADGDGTQDLVWVTGGGVSCWLGGRDVLLQDEVSGGRPVAWGGLDPWSGLAVLWMDPASGPRWRRLSWSGFTDMEAFGSVTGPDWRGRLRSCGGNVLGRADGSWVVHYADGTLEELCPEDDSYSGNFDGAMGAEVVRGESGGLSAWLNPSSGSGKTVLVEAVTADGRGRVHASGLYRYWVFEDGQGGREVYLEPTE